VKKNLDESDVNKIVLSNSKANKSINNSKILKTIYVKNRIINYIIKK
jgi:leucyl-tRNA synthetase